ncbi:MAG: hypothetical protein ACHQFX_02310 [Chitinophagales bacterium]
MPLSLQKIAGGYYLHRVKETASGFKLNPDGTFQFFFTYGALDRYGAGNFKIENETVILQSRAWSGKDFALINSDISGRGTTIKITDKNPIFQKHVFASLKNGEDGSWQSPDTKGEVNFPNSEASVITLAFEFCPERFTFFPIENKEHNYFEFRLESWIMEVFFNQFSLRVKGRVLLGKHPLL